MRVNIEDGKIVKMFNPTLKIRETILFFSIVVINGLIWIDLYIGLDMYARGGEGRSAPVTKFSQPKAWISLKKTSVEANAAPQSK